MESAYKTLEGVADQDLEHDEIQVLAAMGASLCSMFHVGAHREESWRRTYSVFTDRVSLLRQREIKPTMLTQFIEAVSSFEAMVGSA